MNTMQFILITKYNILSHVTKYDICKPSTYLLNFNLFLISIHDYDIIPSCICIMIKRNL